ncbi:MAG: methyltransferase domain-containing protein [bacterium]|nr:methyltransferase domain-containing protein [bacterium]
MIRTISRLLLLFAFIIFSIAINAQNLKPAAPVSVLTPVYAPLADFIVDSFCLSDKNGVGLDLGGGKGDLVIELARRTPSMYWINVDIDPESFAACYQRALEAGLPSRVTALQADVHDLPFKDGYADVIVSRGSFPFWKDWRVAFAEAYRVLKPGGVAYIGRGFSPNLPVEVARSVREAQSIKKNSFPKYTVEETRVELERVMADIGVKSFTIHCPQPPGSEGVLYGIWLEMRK